MGSVLKSVSFVVVIGALVLMASCTGESRYEHERRVAGEQVRAIMPPPRTPEEEAKLIAEDKERKAQIAKWAKERTPAAQAQMDADMEAWAAEQDAKAEARERCGTLFAGDAQAIAACYK
jgi:hypothetical protein